MSIQQLGPFDLVAPRFTLYKEAIAIINYDLTGATFKMQIRTDWNTSGTPLLDLGNAASSIAQGLRVAYAGSDTINNHIAAGRMSSIPQGYVGTTVVMVTVISIRILKANMGDNLPYMQNRDDDYPAVYDLWITPSGGDEERWLRGNFTIQAGATR